MNLEKLQVELTADTKQYKKEMKEAAKVAKETGKEIEKTNKTSDALSTKDKVRLSVLKKINKACKSYEKAMEGVLTPKEQIRKNLGYKTDRSILSQFAEEYEAKKAGGSTTSVVDGLKAEKIELYKLEKELIATSDKLTSKYNEAKNEVTQMKERLAEISKMKMLYDDQKKLGLNYPSSVKTALLEEEAGLNSKINDKNIYMDGLADKISATQGKLSDLRSELIKVREEERKIGQSSGMANLKADATETSQKVKTVSKSFNSMSKSSSHIKKAQKNMRSLRNESGKLHGILGRVKYMFQTMIIMRGFYAAIQWITEGFQNLAQYSSSANAQISNLKSSMTQLKNTLAAAFLPILEAITPALQKLIGWLTKGIEAVGMFFAALQGKTTYTRAVYAQEDYAASLKNSADAANELKKATMGFDEINTLDSGNSGASNGYQAPTAQMMFETVEIEEDMVKLGETILTIIGIFALLKIGMMAYNVVAAITAITTGAISWPVLAVVAAIIALIAIIALVIIYWDDIKAAALEAVEKIKEKWQEFKEWFGTKVDEFKEKWNKGVEKIKTAWSLGVQAVKDKWTNGINTLKTAWKLGLDKVKSEITNVVNNIKEKWNNFINSISNLWDKLWGKVKEVGTKIKDLFSSIFGKNKDINVNLNTQGVSAASVPQYATGGFPEDGLFMANHNELVGQFSNGKTAVANNNQIVQGIQKGVFTAVDAALKQNGGNNDGFYIQNVIKLGNDTIYKAMEKGQKKYDRRMKPATT